jgi:hypothetical protein
MTRSRAPLLTWVIAFALSAAAGAQPSPPIYRVFSEFGHGGCAANPEFDVSGDTPVQAGSGSLGCVSGFGEVASAAGPGILVSSVDVNQTGFGTGTHMETQAEFTVPFMLLSDTDTTASIALNLVLTGEIVTNTTNLATHSWTVLVTASLDGGTFAMGAQRATGSSGFAVPFPDGVPHAFNTNGVLVTTNTPHTLRLALTVSAGVSEFGGHVSLADTTLTLATAGPVFILPDGVTVADIPALNVVGNRWIDPSLPPDVVIDANTSQATLDGLLDVPGSVVVDNATGRTTLDLPNLTSVGCDLRITRNPDLMSFTAPALDEIGCNFTVSDNPALEDVTADIGNGVGGSVAIDGNDAAAEVVLNSGGGIGGDITVGDNSAATNIDLSAGGGIGGSVTVSDNSAAQNIALNMTGGIGGDVTVRDNTRASAIDLRVGQSIGGSVTITDNDGASTIDLRVGQSIAGDVNFSNNGEADINVDTPHIGGDATISTRGSAVSATTGDGTTAVTLANGPATMTVMVPAGTFTSGVRFSIESLGAEPASGGLDSQSNPVAVAPLTAYQFSFAIPTLNQAATLTFDIDVAALGAGATTFLDALGSNRATLGVKGDAPGSVYQTFAVCSGDQLPSAGGCVAIQRLDAAGQPLPAGDPSVPATVRFTGATGHFSTFAVVLVTPIDSTPPALNLPAPIVVDAISPGGASVTYAVTATDGQGGPVTIACVPPSGSMFPAGTTQVACTATDASGNQSTGGFSVTVRGAADLIVDLIELVRGSQLPALQETRLVAFLQTALGNPRNVGRTCDALRLFVLLVQAQSGRSIPAARATALIGAATRIRAVLGC